MPAQSAPSEQTQITAVNAHKKQAAYADCNSHVGLDTAAALGGGRWPKWLSA